MPRAPFQILVLPYRQTAEEWEFAVLSRSDRSCRQGIAGGGEDTETPLEAAKRESSEEAGLPDTCHFLPLQAVCSVPVMHFQDAGTWDPALYVVPEYSFGVDCTGRALALSDEHHAVEWLSYAETCAAFTYDSGRTALWELNQRLHGWGPREGVT